MHLLYTFVWRNYAPPKVKFFPWLLIQNCIQCKINLRKKDDPRAPHFLKRSEKTKNFLMEYRDCFTWNYKEMLGLDTRVITHKLAIDPQLRSIKQSPRRLRPEFQFQVIAKVDKLAKVEFVILRVR